MESRLLHGSLRGPRAPFSQVSAGPKIARQVSTGYVRLDWFTPNGLSTWGDGRLTILGTEGYIELRKYVDIAGRPGGNHLFIVDNKETRSIDCEDVDLPFGPRLVSGRGQPHRDRDTAGAHVPDDGARAQGPEAGAGAQPADVTNVATCAPP